MLFQVHYWKIPCIFEYFEPTFPFCSCRNDGRDAQAGGQLGMKLSQTMRRFSAALTCAVLMAVSASAVAMADDETPPVVDVLPTPLIPVEPPTEETPPTEDTPAAEPPAGEGDGTVPVVEQPVTEPAEPVQSPADPARAVVPFAPVQDPPAYVPELPELPAPEVEEAVPASEPPMPSATPTTAVVTTQAAVPAAAPAPVSKAIDSVVATAAGSPLHIQLLTVALLLAAGFLYFRVLGSKGRRSPVKPGK